jgi:hypothetical protein
MSDPLKPFSSGLPDSVERLARRASAVETLAEKVRNASEPLRPHVIGAVRRGEDLVVIVDSAAWSARVRYAGRGLNASLVQTGELAFDRLRVRVGAPAA